MTFLGSLLVILATGLNFILAAYQFIILGAVILSFIRPDPYNPIVRFIYQATQPVFNRIRRALPAVLFRSGLDFTPMIVLFLLFAIDRLVIMRLMRIGLRLEGM